MTNQILETINPQTAVLFMYGNLNDVARQFLEMLRYCKNKHLHINNLFFDTSNIKSTQKDCFFQLLDYLSHNKTKYAVVFYDRKEYNKFPWINMLEPFRETKRIKLHFVKDNVTI